MFRSQLYSTNYWTETKTFPSDSIWLEWDLSGISCSPPSLLSADWLSPHNGDTQWETDLWEDIGEGIRGEDEAGRWVQHSTTWCFPPTFGRRWVTMAIQRVWLLRDASRETDRGRGRCVLWRASLSGGAMEHTHPQETVLSITQLKKQTPLICGLYL